MQRGGLAAQSFNVCSSTPRSFAAPRRVPIAPRVQWVQRCATPGYPLRCYCNGWNATNRHKSCGLVIVGEVLRHDDLDLVIRGHPAITDMSSP